MAEKNQDEKLLEMASRMAEKIVEGLVPHLVATTNILQKNTGGAQGQPNKRPEFCHICQQAKSACNGEHAEIVVYPQRRTEYGQWFQGYRLNGVNYLSNGPRHTVVVPKCCASEISAAVRTWEETEANMRQGKQAEHYSGSVDKPSRVEHDGTRFR